MKGIGRDANSFLFLGRAELDLDKTLPGLLLNFLNECLSLMGSSYEVTHMKNCHLMTSIGEAYLLALFYIFECCCIEGRELLVPKMINQ